jgi:hypothetical protein
MAPTNGFATKQRCEFVVALTGMQSSGSKIKIAGLTAWTFTKFKSSAFQQVPSWQTRPDGVMILVNAGWNIFD